MDDQVRMAAQEALSHLWNAKIALEKKDAIVDYEGATSHIYRCSVVGNIPGKPGTVVVKYAVPRNGLLVREWVAYDLLLKSPLLEAHLPRHFFIDRELEFSVMEDLGDFRESRLGEVLFQADRARAVDALLEYARLLAVAHAETVGRQDEWRQQFRAWGGSGQTRHKVFRLVQTMDSFSDAAGRMGIDLDQRVQEEIQEVRLILESPGPFLTLSHGDSTPANFIILEGRSWIFDWETAAFRHCLLDGTFSQVRDLHSIWARDIPKAVRRRMYDAYRQTLAKRIPEAADASIYLRHFSACCLAWLGGLLDFYPRVVVEDARWGHSTLRQRIAAGLSRIYEWREIGKYFPGLHALAGDMGDYFAEAWPPEDRRLDFFPAFK